MCTSKDEILTQELNQKRYELNLKLSREWILNGGVTWIPNLIEVLEDTDRMYALSKNNPDYMLYPYSIQQVKNYLQEVFRLYDKEDLWFLFKQLMMITWEDKKEFNPSDIWNIYPMLYHPVLGIRGFDIVAITDKDAKAVDHTIEQMGHFRQLFFKRLISIAKDSAKATKLTNKKEEKKMTSNIKKEAQDNDTKFKSLLVDDDIKVCPHSAEVHKHVFEELKQRIQEIFEHEEEYSSIGSKQREEILNRLKSYLERLDLRKLHSAFDGLYAILNINLPDRKYSVAEQNYLVDTVCLGFNIDDRNEVDTLKRFMKNKGIEGLRNQVMTFLTYGRFHSSEEQDENLKKEISDKDTKFSSILHANVFDNLKMYIRNNLNQDPDFNTMSTDQKKNILKKIPDKLIPRLNFFNEDDLKSMAQDLYILLGKRIVQVYPFNFSNSINTLVKFFHIKDIEEINRIKDKYNESQLKGLSSYFIKRLFTDDIPAKDVDDQIPFYEPELALVPICLDVKCDDTGSANQEMVKSEMDTVKAIFNYPPSLRLHQNHRTIFPFYIPQLGEMKYSLQYQGMHIMTIKAWMDYRIYPFERVDGYKVEVDPNKIKHPERSICLSFQFQHNSFFACESLLDKLWNSIKNRNYHITAYAMEKVGTKVRIVESSRWFCTNLDVFNEYAPLHPGLNNLNHRLLMFSTQDLQKHFDVEQYNAGWVGPFIEFDEKIFPD